MATRRTTKAQPRPKRDPETVRIIANASNGVAATLSLGSNGKTPNFEQIQRRAYELFEARGGAHGYDLADWFTAEQELTATSIAAH